jgi:CHASE2 domain-containing sensor protein
MENFIKTILYFFLLFGGCIMVIIALILICLMLFGNQDSNPAIPWTIALGIGGGGLIYLSIRSLKRNAEDEDE